MLILTKNHHQITLPLVRVFILLVQISCASVSEAGNKTLKGKDGEKTLISVIKEGVNRTADYDDEYNPSDENYPGGYKLIKEETIEEILDLEPDTKSPSPEASENLAGQDTSSKHDGIGEMYNVTGGAKREPKQVIRIDKPREDGRTRITVSANLLREKMMMLGQNSKNQIIRDLTRSPSGDLDNRVLRVPQRIIIADGGMISAPTRRPIDSAANTQSNLTSAPLPPVKVAYPVPESHHLLAKPDTKCPKWGPSTIEHPAECDKYYFCEGGMISEQTCPNGLVYGVINTVVDYCIYRWEATCGDKSIPNPVSSPGCRWQYGLFTVQGSPRCSQNYYECKAGKYEIKQCPLDGQVYDDLSKSCREGKSVGCAIDALAEFHCPHDDQSNHYWPFPRYFLNDKTIIHCINDRPELVKCNSDERVDPERLICTPTGDRVRVEEKIPEILEQGRNRMRDD